MNVPVLVIAGAGGMSGDAPFFGPSPLNQLLTVFPKERKVIKLDAPGRYGIEDRFDFSMLIQDGVMAPVVDVLAHSHGADMAVEIASRACGNFDIRFRMVLYDPVRRNAFTGPLGLLMQTWSHDPIELTKNVDSCLCVLRSSMGFPIHSPLKTQTERWRNVWARDSDHNSVCTALEGAAEVMAMAQGTGEFAIA